MKVPYRIEDLGIEFSRFAAKECEVHCATWRDGDNSHIYKVEMTPHPAGWHASLSNDGRNVGGVTAESRSRCADMAMGAMRAYIVRGHRRTLRSLRRGSDAAYAELHPYALDLLDKCDSDLSLAQAVESILLKRGIPSERMRGVDFAKALELFVVSVAQTTDPAMPAPNAKEGGAE